MTLSSPEGVREGVPAGVPAGVPLADIDFAAQVAALQQVLGTDLPRPVASLLHLGAAAACCAPLLATAATEALLPAVALEDVRFSYPSSGRLQLAFTVVPEAAPGYLPALADQLIEVCLRGLLEPFTEALVAVVPLPEKTLQGNVFSALAAAARLVGSASAGTRARALVDLISRRYVPLHDAGTFDWRAADPGAYFRRRNCCLFYQVPGGGTCGDCVLLGSPAR